MSPLAMLLGSGVSGQPVRKLALVVAAIGLAWTLLVGLLGLAVYCVYLLLSIWLVTWAAVAVTAALCIGGACAVIFWPHKDVHEVAEDVGHDLLTRYAMQGMAAAFTLGFLLAVSSTVRQIAFREVSKLIMNAAL